MKVKPIQATPQLSKKETKQIIDEVKRKPSKEQIERIRWLKQIRFTS